MKKTVAVMTWMLAAHLSLLAGLEWKATTDFSGETKKAVYQTNMTIQAQGGNVKQIFDTVSGENMMYRQGDYWLFRSADNAFYGVSPADKTYWEIPLDYMFKMTQTVGKIVKIKIKDPKIAKEMLSPETLLGISCQHYKMTIEYDMEVKVVLLKSRSHEIQVKEVWSSPQVKGLAEIATTFRQKDYKTGFADLDALIEEQLKAEGDLGFPLKIVTVNSSVDKKGETKEKSRMVMTVTQVAAKLFPAAVFEIPAGYQKKDMSQSLFKD